MGLADDAWESRMPPDDPRIAPTYSALRADLDEQARRIGLARGLTEQALGTVQDMVDRQARGSYILQITLQRIKRVLETGQIT